MRKRNLIRLLLGLALATPLTAGASWGGGSHFGAHPGWGGHIPPHPIRGPGFYHPGPHYPWFPGHSWFRPAPIYRPIIWAPGTGWGGWGSWRWNEYHRIQRLDQEAFSLNQFAQNLPMVTPELQQSLGYFDNAVVSLNNCLRTPVAPAGYCSGAKDEVYQSWGAARGQLDAYMGMISSEPGILNPMQVQMLQTHIGNTEIAVEQLSGFFGP